MRLPLTRVPCASGAYLLAKCSGTRCLLLVECYALLASGRVRTQIRSTYNIMCTSQSYKHILCRKIGRSDH